jgi:hypothetical protein
MPDDKARTEAEMLPTLSEQDKQRLAEILFKEGLVDAGPRRPGTPAIIGPDDLWDDL